jgi:hypothetical protein
LRPEERAQALLDIKANDIVGKWGVLQVRQRLANRGVLISRYGISFLFYLNILNVVYFSDETRTHLHDHFEHEFDKRMVGLKKGIVRVPLDCLGPWHQLHWDGHEKVGVQALNMGDVGLPIYAGKDQYSTFVPIMRVIPNVRLGETIGHLFLDMVEDYGCASSLRSVVKVAEYFRRHSTSNDDRQRLRNLGDDPYASKTEVSL